MTKTLHNIRNIIGPALFILVLYIFMVLFYRPVDEMAAERSLEQAIQSSREPFLLSEITNFDWDYVCVIGPFSHKSDLLNSFASAHPEKQQEMQDNLGMPLDIRIFFEQIPRMDKLYPGSGLYYEMALVFFYQSNVVARWRFSTSTIDIFWLQTKIEKRTDTTCVSNFSSVVSYQPPISEKIPLLYIE